MYRCFTYAPALLLIRYSSRSFYFSLWFLFCFFLFFLLFFFFFFSSRRRHTRSLCDWSSDVCSSDLRLQIDILPEFTRHFGPERVSRWFGPQVGCVALSESANVSSYHAQVEALFDLAAPAYDRTVQADPLNLHPRQVSAQVLRNLFSPGSRVLELGCGTGLETIPLAASGVNVVALDISAQMLAELERKANAASLARRIITRKGLLSDLSEIVSEFGPGSFDGAFSHFGALNCEPSLNGLPEALHERVKPVGRLSLGDLNRTSPPPIGWRSEERRVGK